MIRAATSKTHLIHRVPNLEFLQLYLTLCPYRNFAEELHATTRVYSARSGHFAITFETDSKWRGRYDRSKSSRTEEGKGLNGL